MSAEYMHIGIPITNKKPGMTYNEGAKFWVSNVDDYDYPSVFNFGQVDHSDAGPFRRVLLCDPQFLSPRLQPATNRSIIQRHVITLKHPSKDNLFI